MSSEQVAGVLVSGQDLAALAEAVRIASAVRTRYGLNVPPEWAKLRALATGNGHEDAPPIEADEDLLSTAEIARLLHCSPRQARRMVPLLDGRLVGGRWLAPRAAVLEHLKGMSA
ncbi:helix-turn-helix domain-containing protein [Dietzia timorensis]|uniref:Helix-turn-helix domain-containing protein n=1 Tax=Dietzia timorensis TaxID=499555 RepID=A0A173LJP2_9ACTN|nr:helix-turn-helix domain-containing protein [Dietzia timorensis]ANI91671.1 Hypothetical protein BJL86_0877 [Dietzia timorensis]